MIYVSTTEHAAQIRQTLKAKHGWSSRQVSVRADNYSMGSSIDVIIKDPAIPLPVVKAIAEVAEHIRRCEVSGEILGGGNRFVHVTYSREAEAEHGRRYFAAVQAAYDAIGDEGNRLEPVEGTPYLIGRSDGWRITLWRDSFIRQTSTVQGAAQEIGALMVANKSPRGEA
jgi:hypothetical protein